MNLTICLLMDSLTKARHWTVTCCCLITKKHCLPTITVDQLKATDNSITFSPACVQSSSDVNSLLAQLHAQLLDWGQHCTGLLLGLVHLLDPVPDKQNISVQDTNTNTHFPLDTSGPSSLASSFPVPSSVLCAAFLLAFSAFFASLFF